MEQSFSRERACSCAPVMGIVAVVVIGGKAPAERGKCGGTNNESRGTGREKTNAGGKLLERKWKGSRDRARQRGPLRRGTCWIGRCERAREVKKKKKRRKKKKKKKGSAARFGSACHGACGCVGVGSEAPR